MGFIRPSYTGRMLPASPLRQCLLTGGADRAKPTNKRSFFLSFLFFQQNVGFQCIYLPMPHFANLSPRIDSKEPIPQCCVVWRAGTATLFNRFLAPKYCLKIPALCITVYIFSSTWNYKSKTTLLIISFLSDAAVGFGIQRCGNSQSQKLCMWLSLLRRVTVTSSSDWYLTLSFKSRQGPPLSISRHFHITTKGKGQAYSAIGLPFKGNVTQSYSVIGLTLSLADRTGKKLLIT